MKLKTLVLLIAVVSIQLIFLPWLVIILNDKLGFPTLTFSLFQYVGVVLLVPCAWVILYCKRIFRVVGKGTPVPIEPPKEFVAVGLYKHARNPMYISYVFIYFSMFLISGKLLLVILSILAAVFIHLAVVFYEEPSLEKRFGNTYLEYKKTVKRWGLF